MAQPSPQSDPNEGKTPAWGYHYETAAAQLFHVEPGGALPEGFVDNPGKCKGGWLDVGTVPTDPGEISDEELERLTAPDEIEAPKPRRKRKVAEPE